MRRRRWFIGMFSFEISSIARLPRLSSPAMKDDWIYEREKENHYRVFDRQRRAKEQLWVEMCSRPKPSAGIWRHEAKRWVHRDAQKATTINRRRGATSLTPMGIWRWATEGRKSRGTLDKSCVFRLDWIRSLGSAVSNRLFSQKRSVIK